MTTIAYKSGVLAADTLVTSSGKRIAHVRKVGRAGPVLYGACGNLAIACAFMDWVRSGMPGEFQRIDCEDFEGVVILPPRIVCWSRHGTDTFEADQYATGSGSAIALGAMSAGVCAVEAVRAAIVHDIYSGGDVQFVRSA